MRKNIIFIIILICFGLIAGHAAMAFPSIVPSSCAGDADVKECNLSAVEQTIATVAQIILGISGSLALLMFVIGGVMYMTSGGASGRIKTATGILSNAVIGLAIILLAGVIIKILIGKLSGVT